VFGGGHPVVGFARSPGRLDQAYLGNDSAFMSRSSSTSDDGTQGIVDLATEYHERIKRHGGIHLTGLS